MLAARQIVKETVRTGGETTCDVGGRVRVDRQVPRLALAAACLVAMEVLETAGGLAARRTRAGLPLVTPELVRRALDARPELAAEVVVEPGALGVAVAADPSA